MLQQGKSISKNSPLYPLDPLFDEESRLIKVGGMTYQSNLDENFKHQVILPRTHLTKLIVEHYHERALHAGAQTMLYQTRERFWIINGRKYVRQIRITVQHVIDLLSTRPIQKWDLSPKKELPRTTVPEHHELSKDTSKSTLLWWIMGGRYQECKASSPQGDG